MTDAAGVVEYQVCLSVCLSVCLAGWLAVCLSLCVSLCLSVSLSLNLSTMQGARYVPKGRLITAMTTHPELHAKYVLRHAHKRQYLSSWAKVRRTSTCSLATHFLIQM